MKTKQQEQELSQMIAGTEGAAEVGELIGLVEEIWSLLTPEQHQSLLELPRAKRLLALGR